MTSEVVGAVSQSVAFALAMATAGGAGGYRVLHTGAGVARREAYHARRGDERAALDGVDENSLLRAEGGDAHDSEGGGRQHRGRGRGIEREQTTRPPWWPSASLVSLSPPRAAPRRQRSTPAPRTSARFPSVFPHKPSTKD